MIKSSTLARIAFGIGMVVSLFGCSSDSGFTQQATTQYFTQDYNPEFIDVLWMVDNRSSVSYNASMRQLLVNEASKFFTRLDLMASRDYRMGIISTDLEFSPPGELKPRGQRVLYKNYGTLEQRVANFSSIIGQPINLNTGAVNQGIANVREALISTFAPRAGVPLVVVFISDGDDRSSLPSGITQDPVDYFHAEYLRLKGNNPDMLRVYSINYTQTGGRCATQFNADIDRPGFEDRYFRIAQKANGQKADLCGTWADTIDLSGLKLKTLKKNFKLDAIPDTSTLEVRVFDVNQNQFPMNWTYVEATNEIVFDVTPPAGTTIQVLYHNR